MAQVSVASRANEVDNHNLHPICLEHFCLHSDCSTIVSWDQDRNGLIPFFFFLKESEKVSLPHRLPLCQPPLKATAYANTYLAGKPVTSLS